MFQCHVEVYLKDLLYKLRWGRIIAFTCQSTYYLAVAFGRPDSTLQVDSVAIYDFQSVAFGCYTTQNDSDSLTVGAQARRAH